MAATRRTYTFRSFLLNMFRMTYVSQTAMCVIQGRGIRGARRYKLVCSSSSLACPRYPMSLKSGISLVVEAPLSYHLEMFRAILSAIFRLLVIFRVHERFKRQEGFGDIPVRELSKSVMRRGTEIRRVRMS